MICSLLFSSWLFFLLPLPRPLSQLFCRFLIFVWRRDCRECPCHPGKKAKVRMGAESSGLRVDATWYNTYVVHTHARRQAGRRTFGKSPAWQRKVVLLRHGMAPPDLIKTFARSPFTFYFILYNILLAPYRPYRKCTHKRPRVLRYFYHSFVLSRSHVRPSIWRSRGSAWAHGSVRPFSLLQKKKRNHKYWKKKKRTMKWHRRNATPLPLTRLFKIAFASPFSRQPPFAFFHVPHASRCVYVR